MLSSLSQQLGWDDVDVAPGEREASTAVARVKPKGTSAVLGYDIAKAVIVKIAWSHHQVHDLPAPHDLKPRLPPSNPVAWVEPPIALCVSGDDVCCAITAEVVAAEVGRHDVPSPPDLGAIRRSTALLQPSTYVQSAVGIPIQSVGVAITVPVSRQEQGISIRDHGMANGEPLALPIGFALIDPLVPVVFHNQEIRIDNVPVPSDLDEVVPRVAENSL